MALRSNVPATSRTNHHPRRSLKLLPLTLALVASAVIGVAGATPALAAGLQTLDVFAGSGSTGAPTEGPATDSDLGRPNGIAVDSEDNVYVFDADNHYIYKIDPDGDLSIFAGDGTAGAPTPGPATDSPLSTPQGLAVDSDDNLYVAEPTSHHVLMITPAGGLSIFAGDGTAGAPTPGPATDSPITAPTSIALDADENVYITDPLGHRVLQVDTAGDLSVFAGTGNDGTVTPGPATASNLESPYGIAVDSDGVVYFSDSGNLVVLRVDTSGDLAVHAGTGSAGTLIEGPATASPLAQPQGLAIDFSDNLYISDSLNDQVAKVDTSGDLTVYAGTGTAGAPVPGQATSSPFSFPDALATDFYDRLYVADFANFLVDRITGTDVPEAPTSLDPDPGDEEFDIGFVPGDEGSAPVTSFEVSLDNCATWSTLAVTPGPGLTLVGTVSGLDNGTGYEVCVRAVNAVGDGEASDMVEITPMAAATVPGPPTGLRAVAKDRAARLWWKPPANNGGMPIRRYQVNVHGSHWTNLVVSAAPHGERTALITGLRNGGTYKLRVRAVNSVGAGAPSGTVRVKPVKPRRR